MSNSEELYNSENANVLDRLSQEQTAKQRLNEGLLDVDNRVRDSQTGEIEADAGKAEAGLGTGTTTAILGGALNEIYKSNVGKTIRQKALKKLRQKIQERQDKRSQNGEDDDGNDLGDTSNVDPVQSQEISTQTRTDISTKDFPDQQTTPEDLIDPNEPVVDPDESGISEGFKNTLSEAQAEADTPPVDPPPASTETLDDVPPDDPGLTDYGGIFGDPESIQNITNVDDDTLKYGNQNTKTDADDIDTSDITPAQPDPIPPDALPEPATPVSSLTDASTAPPDLTTAQPFSYFDPADPIPPPATALNTRLPMPTQDDPNVSSLTDDQPPPTNTTLAKVDPAGDSGGGGGGGGSAGTELAEQTQLDSSKTLQGLLKSSGIDDDTITNLMSGFSKGSDIDDLLDGGAELLSEGTSSLLGTIGGFALDALGPLGAIGGLVGGIYSLVEQDDASETAEKNATAYQKDLTSLSATPTLSTGSIAMPTMDTTQFRTGGMMNF